MGYVEGRTIHVEVRAAEGRYERLPSLAAELVSLKPSVIVTSATPAAIAAKNATSNIPIVALVVGGLMFAYSEGGSKKVFAGIVFGLGMALGAANFMAWLFP